MKCLVGTLALLLAVLAGCAAPKKAGPQPIVTISNSLTASVALYNPIGRFVVLSFPSGDLPKHDQRFFIYHAGLKAGEVKITGPERENTTVADLITGEAQAGDEVRDQ